MEIPVEIKDDEGVGQAPEPKAVANAPVEKVLKFFSMLPAVSKEVALKVAEQLPELRKIANKALSGLEKAHEGTLKFNEKSQKHVHHAYEDIREVLKGELKEEDMTFEQKKEIYDLLMETGKEESVKDSENKRMLDTWLKTAGVVAVAALAVAVILVGAKSSETDA